MMGCRPAAKSKVVEGCGRGQLEVAIASPRCNEVTIIELPTETTIVQKREDRSGPSGAAEAEEEEEEEEVGKERDYSSDWARSRLALESSFNR